MSSPEKLLQNPAALCNMVKRIAIEAGAITMQYFENQDTSQIEDKEDGSPVSLADREAEMYIQMSLQNILPDILIIGEEAASLGKAPELEGAEYFWLVDPLDGTKEFISGEGDFTVNIALIRNNDPVLGVVFAPYHGRLYAGHGPGTAVRWNEDTNKEKPISVRRPPEEGLTVVASARHGDEARMQEFLDGFKINKLIKHGSSLKICAVAEGRADIYPRLGPTCEWDTAAGDAVLRSAGGFMTDTDGKPLRYGGFNPKFFNPEFIASSFEWQGEADSSDAA